MKTLQKKVQNLKFRGLIMTIIVVFLIMMAILGGVSIIMTRIVASQTSILYNRPHTNLVNMWTSKARISEAGSAIKNAYILESPVSDDTVGNIQGIPDLILAIENNKVDKTQGVSGDMQVIMDACDLWVEKADGIIALLNNGNSSDITPQMLSDYDAAEIQAVDSISAIIVTASENAKKFNANAAKTSNQAAIVIAGVMLAAVVVSIFVTRLIYNALIQPMNIILSAASSIALGQLDYEIDYKSENEFGTLAQCFTEMQAYLKSVVYDIDSVLEEMQKGNFSVSAQTEYIGDFHSIKESIENITMQLSKTLEQINQSADQVFLGASNMSEAAQNLGEGAADQSAAVEELAATLGSVSEQITLNAENAAVADSKVESINSHIMGNSTQMDKVKEAMTDISDKSNEIGQIIHTIEDIASQTNLLSLNASIEAARAGEAGKGFAVVADEVKNLAEQSAQAAKDTTKLIESCLAAIENGMGVAKRTADSLVDTARETTAVTQSVAEISGASKNQANALEQLMEGVDQISGVVENNSAMAEETAAASEELSCQSRTLKELVGVFKLRKQ